MTLKELATIACWLNQATIRIRKENGKIEWLTGVRGEEVVKPDGQSEETQCMSWKSHLLIANNSQADTETQIALLNKLNIREGPQLFKFITEEGQPGGRVFPVHAGAINTSKVESEGGKLGLLHDLCEDPRRVPAAGKAVLPGNEATASLREIKLTANKESAVALAGITFVTGTYEGEGTDNWHAEQKLLAALGLLRKTGIVPSGIVTVAGIKSACGVCGEALEDAKAKFARRLPAIDLVYENIWLDRMRSARDLSPKKTSTTEVKKIDLDAYLGRSPESP